VFIKKILISFVVIVGLFNNSVAYSVQVIANTNVRSLTESQLRQIFLMRQLYWPDKQKIVVFVLPRSHPLHQDFSKKILGLLPYRLDQTWNKLTYSGLGTAPIVVQSRQALIDAVLDNPGAIGYVEDGTNIKDKYVIPIKN
jgi:ABC-type phosphate transport system substrate-binding protein